MMNKFEELKKLNVNDKVEKKKSGTQELSYLSWAYAVDVFTTFYPEWEYKIKTFQNVNGVEVPYMGDDITGYMVATNITVDGKTKDMWLPVMDSANKAMKSFSYTYSTKFNGEKTVDVCSMFDVNKAIMRCLVKNMAMFGLGLYIYAGEDLPEGDTTDVVQKTTKASVSNADLEKQLSNCNNVQEWVVLFNRYEDEIKNTDMMKVFQAKRKELTSKNAKTSAN